MTNKIIASVMVFFINACDANSVADEHWRALELHNTVLLTLPHGKVVIELAPQFSPHHVKQFSTLLKNDFYDDTTFYRVIDGFVAQAGPKEGSDEDKSVPALNIEGQWSTDKNWSFTQVQTNDLFSATTGFKQGFALAYSAQEQAAWLTHCPGTLVMACGNEADSASSHFYVVIGQAPRYLDRIMTIFGRVVYGMEHIQSIQRTAVIEGERAIDHRDHIPIVHMQLMADVPKAEQIIIEVENTESSDFTTRLVKRRERAHEFSIKNHHQC